MAIKVALGSVSRDRDRSWQEARALAALSHPNVVTVLDFGVHEGLPYIVMELLRGQTIRQRLRSPYAPWEALAWASDVIAGLAAVHAAGLLHLDLKPENLFLTREGAVKLLDFGIAKATEHARLKASRGPPRESETGTRRARRFERAVRSVRTRCGCSAP